MITYVKGNLFSSPAQVLVNTVNTVGVMGKGIAKEFKAIYPDMFHEYQALCESGELRPGRLMLHRTPHKWILNFPTKRHWRQKSKVEDIEAGLRTFEDQWTMLGAFSYAFPQLGCGNGELNWEADVRPVMERYLGSLPIDVYIHTYDQSLLPEHRDVRRMRNWLRNEPRSLAYEEFWEDVVAASSALGTAALVDVEMGIGDESGGVEPALKLAEDVIVSKTQLFDVWQQWRTTGLLAADDLPDSIESCADRFMEVLGSLRYVEPISFASVGKMSGPAMPVTLMLSNPADTGLRLDLSGAPGRRDSSDLLPVTESDQLCLSGMTATR